MNKDTQLPQTWKKRFNEEFETGNVDYLDDRLGDLKSFIEQELSTLETKHRAEVEEAVEKERDRIEGLYHKLSKSAFIVEAFVYPTTTTSERKAALISDEDIAAEKQAIAEVEKWRAEND